MNDARRLYQLQEVDLELAAKQEALNKVQSRLGDASGIKEAEAAREKARVWLKEMEKAQRSTEAEVEDVMARVKEVEAKLYGGKITNLKELAGLQEESKQLRAKLKEKEDRVLEVMGELDGAQKSIASQEAGLKEVQAQWNREHESLVKERDSLKALVAQLTEKRKKVAEEIPAPSLSMYESLRGALQGHVLAKVAQGRCQGCRLSLSITELKLARGSKLVQCSSCRRILFLE